MGHHSCTCHTACSGAQATPHTATCRTGFLKEYGSILLSALLLLTGIVWDATGIPFFRVSSIRFIWYFVSYLPVGIPVLAEAWESICRKDLFSEFTLMSIATFGAFYIGEYPEAVAVMLFYSLGELFQDKAVDKAKRNISALMDVRPEQVTVLRDGVPQTVSPQAVQPGEVIEVTAGGRVPLDGVLLNDTASFNTAALTGESLPRPIRQGEEVLAGMLVTDRVIRLKVTRNFGESALSRILELVQNAAARKAPAELFIRKFARIYTPVVTALAALIVLLPWGYSLQNTAFPFVFDEWLYRALVFLVISCPCALVVSIPLGYFGGIGTASRMGILFKGGNYLDTITHIDTVVFDKTGTLTKGNFEVQSCHTAPGFTEERLLQLAASAEQHSTHPIAKAIASRAASQNLSLLPTSDTREIAGRGLETRIAGERVLAGNTRLLAMYGIDYPQTLDTVAETVVVCATGTRYAGHLLLSDTLKEDARAAIDALKAMGIRDIRMLSGDKQAIVTAFAAKLGIAHAYGDLLPDGKMKHVEALCRNKASRIAFVGDGINDAPVLALSHVGIAMGGLGSDAAIETADVVIQTDQPSKVAAAIRIGRQTRRIVWQNIALALGVKLLVLALGAAGIATLWEAVFADVGVALLAILNAVRLQRMKSLSLPTAHK